MVMYEHHHAWLSVVQAPALTHSGSKYIHHAISLAPQAVLTEFCLFVLSVTVTSCFVSESTPHGDHRSQTLLTTYPLPSLCPRRGDYQGSPLKMEYIHPLGKFPGPHPGSHYPQNNYFFKKKWPLPRYGLAFLHLFALVC